MILPRGLGIRVVRDLVRGLGGRIVAAAAAGPWIAHYRYFAAERQDKAGGRGVSSFVPASARQIMRRSSLDRHR